MELVYRIIIRVLTLFNLMNFIYLLMHWKWNDVVHEGASVFSQCISLIHLKDFLSKCVLLFSISTMCKSSQNIYMCRKGTLNKIYNENTVLSFSRRVSSSNFIKARDDKHKRNFVSVSYVQCVIHASAIMDPSIHERQGRFFLQ